MCMGMCFFAPSISVRSDRSERIAPFYGEASKLQFDTKHDVVPVKSKLNSAEEMNQGFPSYLCPLTDLKFTPPPPPPAIYVRGYER